MAQKLLKAGGKRKIASKRPDNCVAAASSPSQVVLVGTYREKQLDWIKKNAVYNYPLAVPSASSRTGADPQQDYSRITELWLYAGAKAKRHCFAAEFVGIQSKAEFLAANPTYAKKVGKPSHAQYAVFKTKPFDYGPKLEGKTVVARAIDFASGRGQTKKVAAAIRQFHADGEFAPLAAYLPKELAKVPRPQLRVCEAAVQFVYSSWSPVREMTPQYEKIESLVLSINTFSRKNDIPSGEAFKYLETRGGLSYLDEEYEASRCFSLEAIVEDVERICRRNGGAL